MNVLTVALAVRHDRAVRMMGPYNLRLTDPLICTSDFFSDFCVFRSLLLESGLTMFLKRSKVSHVQSRSCHSRKYDIRVSSEANVS